MYSNLDSFLGFTDSIKEPRKTKVEKQFLKLVRDENGRVINYVTFLVNRILMGECPIKEENVTYWSVRLRDYTKPKTEYRLIASNGTYIEINKTFYDFCVYCIGKGLTSEQVINMCLEKEKNRSKALRLEEEKHEREENERKSAEQEELKRVKEMIRNEVINLPDDEKDLMQSIFNSISGYGSAALNYTLLALIHHFDNPICKQQIKERLHNDNKASIKTFECMTGLKLPKSYRARMVFLDTISARDFKGMCNYKTEKKPSKPSRNKATMETFYILCTNEGNKEWKPVIAEPINKYGVEMFLFKEAGLYNLSLARSGLKISEGASKTACVDRAEQIIKDRGMKKFLKKIEQANELTQNAAGLNPRYKQ